MKNPALTDNLTDTEKRYLNVISSNGGRIATRALRDRLSPHRSSFAGMSALGGICKVLRRLEVRGLVRQISREEYEVTDDGLQAVVPDKAEIA